MSAKIVFEIGGNYILLSVMSVASLIAAKSILLLLFSSVVGCIRPIVRIYDNIADKRKSGEKSKKTRDVYEVGGNA